MQVEKRRTHTHAEHINRYLAAEVLSFAAISVLFHSVPLSVRLLNLKRNEQKFNILAGNYTSGLSSFAVFLYRSKVMLMWRMERQRVQCF